MVVAWCEACVEKKRVPLCRCDAVMMLVFGEGKHDQVEGTKQLPKIPQPRRHGKAHSLRNKKNPRCSDPRDTVFWRIS
jgi:hypothetical protein